MKFSRRNFIKLGGASMVAVLGCGGAAFGRKKSFFAGNFPSETAADRLFGYSANDFRKYLGTKFSLKNGSAAFTVVLAAVKSSVIPANTANQNIGAECFTLSFDLPSNAPQATYTVFHPNLGTFDLFLVPGKTNESRSLLHAVINRI